MISRTILIRQLGQSQQSVIIRDNFKFEYVDV